MDPRVGTYLLDDISVYIFNWNRVSINSLVLYDKISKVLKNVTIVNCDEKLILDQNIKHIQLDDSHYYGSQFTHAIRDVNPNSICCMIVGDNVHDNNFPLVFHNAVEAFNTNSMGVYAPNDRRSPHSNHLEHIIGSLYNVDNTDCGFWFINPMILASIKEFDFSISKYGWGIDFIVIAQARKQGFLVCRDYSTETDQLDHNCYYDHNAALVCWSVLDKEYNNWLASRM